MCSDSRRGPTRWSEFRTLVISVFCCFSVWTSVMEMTGSLSCSNQDHRIPVRTNGSLSKHRRSNPPWEFRSTCRDTHRLWASYTLHTTALCFHSTISSLLCASVQHSYSTGVNVAQGKKPERNIEEVSHKEISGKCRKEIKTHRRSQKIESHWESSVKKNNKKVQNQGWKVNIGRNGKREN